MSEGLDRLTIELHGKLERLQRQLEEALGLLGRDTHSTRGVVTERITRIRAARAALETRVTAARVRMRESREACRAESEEQLADWQAARELRQLTVRAGRAEEYAADAILLARMALDEAEAATLEAIEARIVADEVDLFAPNGRLSISASDEGTVAYQRFTSDRSFLWYGREGRPLGEVFEREDCRVASLSPDGRRIAMVINDNRRGTGDLWLHDLERDLSTRLTDTPDPFNSDNPSWAPDGSRVLYDTNRAGPVQVWSVLADGSATLPVLDAQGQTAWQPVFAPYP